MFQLWNVPRLALGQENDQERQLHSLQLEL
jgi:hypothetical protein